MDEKTRKATLLWTSAQPVVAAFVASVIRDTRDREDVLQETALAIFNSIGSYDSKLPFNAWAVGVARNQIGLYLRRRKRDRHVFGEATIAPKAKTSIPLVLTPRRTRLAPPLAPIRMGWVGT